MRQMFSLADRLAWLERCVEQIARRDDLDLDVEGYLAEPLRALRGSLEDLRQYIEVELSAARRMLAADGDPVLQYAELVGRLMGALGTVRMLLPGPTMADRIADADLTPEQRRELLEMAVTDGEEGEGDD